MFHERNVIHDPADLPSPGHRDPRQLYVLHSLESPMFSDMVKMEDTLRNYFNVSINYRRDAEVRNSVYGDVVRVRQHPAPGPALDNLIAKFGRENRHLAHKTEVKLRYIFILSRYLICL